MNQSSWSGKNVNWNWAFHVIWTSDPIWYKTFCIFLVRQMQVFPQEIMWFWPSVHWKCSHMAQNTDLSENRIGHDEIPYPDNPRKPSRLLTIAVTGTCHNEVKYNQGLPNFKWYRDTWQVHSNPDLHRISLRRTEDKKTAPCLSFHLKSRCSFSILLKSSWFEVLACTDASITPPHSHLRLLHTIYFI